MSSVLGDAFLPLLAAVFVAAIGDGSGGVREIGARLAVMG